MRARTWAACGAVLAAASFAGVARAQAATATSTPPLTAQERASLPPGGSATTPVPAPNQAIAASGSEPPPTAAYTLDGWGGIHPFGIGTTPVGPLVVSGNPYWFGWDIARGIALTCDGHAGYTLDGWGGVHPFRVDGGSAPPPVSGTPYWFGWDIARGIALQCDGTTTIGGYVVDGWGGIHPFRVGNFATPPSPIGPPMPLSPDDPPPAYYWPGDGDAVQGISMARNQRSLDVVDGHGRVYTFAISTTPPWPVATDGPYWPDWNIARDLAVLPYGTADNWIDGNGAYVLDGFGGLHPVVYDSPPPPETGPNQAYWPGWDIARGVAIALYQ